MEKFREDKVYVCNYCSKSFGSIEMVEQHLQECLLNGEDTRSCIGCKHCVIHLVPPTGNSNHYKSIRLQEIVGNKSYIKCGIEHYKGKLSEEKVLRMNKGCFELADYDSNFIVEKDEDYKRYEELINLADVQQTEIDKEIEQVHKDIQELSDEEFDNKYKDM